MTAGAAQAVSVSGDGRGQVLLYPYYTARADTSGNAFSTLISVVNPSEVAKALRVRVREGKNGRPVLDFNLYLSPYDVWTAAMLPNAATGGAQLGTLDASCTLPSFATAPTAPFMALSNSNYSGANDDGGGSSLDRTMEGYIEVFEMASYAAGSATATAITHVDGVPPCGSGLNDTQATADAQTPTGGLFGAETLINVNAGTDYTADSVALANFYQIGPAYSPAGNVQPNLTGASPPVSAVTGPDGTGYQSLWGQGAADAVSAVLMHDSVLNEYVLDTATKSGTDWILTMPTKPYYVGVGSGNATKLFQRNFNGSVGSCDDITLSLWDREERKAAGVLNFTPPSPTPTSSLCWTANVITFNQTAVLGSTNLANLQAGSFQNGWLSVAFPAGPVGVPSPHRLDNTGLTSVVAQGGASSSGHSVAYFGLPVIGFAIVSFANGTLQVGIPPATVLSNYGGDFRHKTSTNIQ